MIQSENKITRFLVEHGKISQGQYKELLAESREVRLPADKLFRNKEDFT